MLFDPLATALDPQRLAESEARFEGRIVLAADRLAALVEKTPADAWVRLVFDRGPWDCPRVRGEVQAEVICACQRCREPFPYTLESRWELVFATSDEQVRILGEEGLDCHHEPGPLDMAAMIEDELMLALPMAPHHEPACMPWVQTDEAPHPFAALKGLFARDGHDK
ncbi:MAG: YceD family protein [Gammaproteobacteria bacterium]|nr:YceD family protein [Gammaproteobacteria bacterium]